MRPPLAPASLPILAATDTGGRAPLPFLSALGEVFAVFDARTQDSGNISYGVRCGDTAFFVKTAGLPDDPRPLLGFPARVGLLENAAALAQSLTPPHPALARLRRVLPSPHGPLLVYDWAPGHLLRGAALAALHAQTPEAALRILDALYDLHRALAAAGWIAVDLYDGSLLYDPTDGRLTVIDLDLYRRGPFRNQMGRMFGSSRFMAPEEHQRGARIDQRTTVFTLGRAACVLLPALQEVPLIQRACAPDPARRFKTVAALVDAWARWRLEI